MLPNMPEILKPQTGQLKEVHEPRLVGEVIVDNLTNSSEQPFNGIRQQLASGRLPNLAQHLGAMDIKAGKEECALC